MLEQKLKLKNPPKIIITGSDQLLESQKKRWHKTFGVPITEQYGMVEFAGNLSKCKNDNYHEDFECCHIEVVENDEYKNNLILTGWSNIAMPLIRYEIGDFIGDEISNCGCGRESRCFKTIEGRNEDYIVTLEGKKIMGMNQVFEYAKNVSEIQLFQKELGSVEFRIIPSTNFSEDDKKGLIRELKRRAGDKLKINFKLVKEIKLTSKGKYKAVISKIK